MKNIISIMIMLCVLIGCDSEKSQEESLVEYQRNARAGDMEMLKGIPTGEYDQKILLRDHPLKPFFVPHGTKALLYIGRFWNSCDKKHQAYTKERCNQAVERGIRIGKSIGIDLKKKDLVDPQYWRQFEAVDEMRMQYLQELSQSSSRARIGNGPSEFQIKDDEFLEKQIQMMQGMDENYGR